MKGTRKNLIFMVGGILIGILLIGGSNYRVKVLKFENIGKGGVLTYKGNIVIKDEVEFRRLWKVWYPRGEYPKVDFSKEMVVGVFLGKYVTGGMGIEIKKIEKRVGRIVVYVEKRLPNYEGMVVQMVSIPTHIVKTERSILPVIFSCYTIPDIGERIEKWILRKYGTMVMHIFGP
ncbi:MAG: protease complex subunit PrcB family protein [bacterium]|nr:protease complex subunit PrcB family protein [bacterium]